jgi:hypothetical protein
LNHKDIVYYKDRGIRAGRVDKIIKLKDYPGGEHYKKDHQEREIVIYLTSKKSHLPPWDFKDDLTTDKTK